MCFSPTASFGASIVLGIASAYSLQQTRASGVKTFFPIALIPLLFAIQQFIEGFVWLGLRDHMSLNPESLETLSYLYLFFAYAFWPFWVPLAISIFDEKKRILFLSLTVIGFVFFVTMISHILIHPGILNTRIVNCSICYLHSETFNFDWGIFLYLTLTCGSLIISSWKHVKILGWIILVSATIAFFIYNTTFASVWCFFSAIISLYICYMARLLNKNPNSM